MTWLEDLVQDARQGVRVLRKAPGFAAIAALTLALGIGATTAVYSVVHGLLLTPLPYPDSERVVYIYQTQSGEQGVGNVSIRNYFDIAERARSFTAVAATGGWFDPSFMAGGLPLRVNGAFGSTDLFRVLGVEPALGRGFTPDDGSDVVVVSHAFWRTHFADQPTIVGETIILDGDPMIVVGVMPEGFRAPMHLDADLWRHFPIRPVGQRRSRNVTVFGRLSIGVDDRLATMDVASIAASLRAEYPADLSETSFGVRSLHEQVFGDSKRPLGILLAAAALLLFVGSVNLSSLLLARATVRRRELVLRLALGARRGRIVRQLLTEGSLLVAIGGAIGLLLARWGTSGLVALGPAVLRTRDIGIDGGVLLFCVGIMIITVPAVALLPAMRASRVRLAESLGDRSGVAQSRGDLRLRDALVVAQLAVTVVMLAAGGALARSLATLHQTDPGFPSSGLVAAEITLPPAGFAGASGSSGFFEEVAREVHALPGVEAAAMTSLLPFSGHYFTTGVRVEGRGYATDDYGEMVDRVIATPEYLSTLGIPVVHGRWLREGDRFGAPGVAIINTHLARRLFGTEDPLGRRIRLSFADSAQTVVGVVGPVHMAALDEPPRGQVYLPLAQAGALEMTLVARASGDPLALVPSIRRAVARVRAEQPVGDVATMDSLVAEARRPVRFMSLLLAALALVALVIATAGLYGVSAYFTRSRRHEFAIRRVLGAQATDVVGLVLRRALRLIALGLLLGVLGALGSGRILSRLLVDVEPGDPLVLTGVAMLLAVISLVASALPAVAVSRVEPRDAMTAS